jgi:hypothetical protein
MSEYFKPTGPTIKVKIPAFTVEVDVELWSKVYGIIPEFGQSWNAAIREDVKGYFGAIDCIVDSTGAAQEGAVQAA